MSSLKAPLSTELVDPADEVALQQGWRMIRARRAAMRPQPTRVLLPAALGLAVAALMLIFWPERAPLRLESGAPLSAGMSLAPASGWTLSDGSRLDTTAAGRVEVGEIAPSALHLVLREGGLELDVRSAGRPVWTVDCGLATVEITGTRLSLLRGADQLTVSVSAGQVRVRSAELTPPVQTVAAGASLLVRPASRVVIATPPSDEPRRPGRARPLPKPSAEAPAPPAPEVQAPPSTEELMRRADAARQAGRGAEAVSWLEQVEARDRAATGALAAYTRGRVLLEDLSQPARAARAFDAALALPLPSGLAESALARAVEAYAQAGERAEAAARARDYAQRYPSGRYRAQVEAWLR